MNKYEKMSKVKLIIFADLHYLDEIPSKPTYDSVKKLYRYAVPLLESLTDSINNYYKPDAVINLGDMIQDTLNTKKDLDNIKFIWEKFKKIQAPYLYVLGNHDLRSMDSIRQVEEIIGYEKSTFSVDINGYHLIVLSTEIRNDLGTKNGGILKTQYVSNQNIEWLKNDLKENTLPCLIFTHYGLAENDMKDNYWFYINSELGLLKNRDIIKNIIKNDKNILAVFSGHLHTNGKFEEDGVTYYHVGSLTYNTEENGIPKYKVEELKDVKNIKEHPDGIYFEVNLNGRNMEIIEHHIDLNKI